MTVTAWLAVAAFLGTYTLIATERVHRVAAALGGAGGSGTAQVLWWALALGAGLGGNATAVGAAANVVVVGIAARNGTPITFWQFTRYGLVVTAVTVAACVPYLWLRARSTIPCDLCHP